MTASKPTMMDSLDFFGNLSLAALWGHRGYWIAVNSYEIVDRDKMFTELVKRVNRRGDSDIIHLEFIR